MLARNILLSGFLLISSESCHDPNGPLADRQVADPISNRMGGISIFMDDALKRESAHRRMIKDEIVSYSKILHTSRGGDICIFIDYGPGRGRSEYCYNPHIGHDQKIENTYEFVSVDF